MREQRVQTEILMGYDNLNIEAELPEKFNKLVLAVRQVQGILIKEGKLQP